MNRIKSLALISGFCLVGLLSYGWLVNSQTAKPSIQLTTVPAFAQILPFEAEATFLQSPTQLTLKALDAAGKTLEQAKIHLQILTKPKNPFLTSDFPIVEGTSLLEMEVFAPSGEIQLQQMLPISGTYQLQTEVSNLTENKFSSFKQTLFLPVNENSVKYFNLAILLTILLVVGAVGGWVIGNPQKIKGNEIAPQPVRLLLSGLTLVAIATLLYINLNAEFAQAQMSMALSHSTESAPPSDRPAQLQSGGLDVSLTGDRDATVGQLAKLEVTVTDAETKQPVKDVNLSITTKALEGEWIAFAYKGVPNQAGKFTWQQQFFDGAPHNIEVEVSPQINSNRLFQPFTVAQNIEVEGVAPPLLVRLITLSYFVVIIGMGFALGFIFRRKQLQNLVK